MAIETYLGNKNLKKVGVPVEYTQEQVKEYIKCSKDPSYFIKNYVKIVNVDTGLVNFEMWPFQEEMVHKFEDNRFVICKLPRQVGKALDVETPILTPDGFKPLLDIIEGDIVYGEDGKPTTVTYATDPMYDHDVYEVKFDNGDVIYADAEHLWTVNSTNWTTGCKNLTTEQLINHTSHTNKPYVNLTAPIICEDQLLPIDPYLLGVWLGDGATRGGTITCHKDDFYNLYQQQFNVKATWADNRNKDVLYFTMPGGQKLLKENNLYGNKHIPVAYLTSSYNQKLELIRGLMDTDGSVTSSGSCEFYQKNEHLVDQFRTLLSCVGIKSRKRYRLINGIRYWTVNFTTSISVFKLHRKINKQKCTNHPKNKRHYIYSITKVTSRPVKCIRVNNSSHLFLAGTTLIPTHNTTTVASYILWQVLFNDQYSVAILANKLAQAREILGRIQTAYEWLPKWLQQGVKEWNKGNIELENGSEILASATSSSAIRGTSQNLIYLDEFAFVPNNLQEEFFASVFPTISSGTSTKVLVTSTPNGMNMFYKIWVDSEEGNNSYVRHDVHWSDVPGRDEKWKQETIKNTSEEQFRQEFCCEFLGSSATLINGRKLAQIPFIYPQHSTNGFDIYEKPKKDHLYVITVDTARGVGLDYSALVVFDVTDLPYKVVGKYRSKEISPMFYPDVIVNAAKMYNDAFVLVELNDLGETVATIIQQDLEYENILSTSVKGRGGQQLSGGHSHRIQLGVKTTKTVKRIGCSNLKDVVENDKIIINDYDLLQELSVFINKRNSYEAEEGHHDDLVMCAVLFSWLVRQEFFIELTDNDVRSRLYLENQKMIEDDVLPFGIVDDGHDTHHVEDSVGPLGYNYDVRDVVDF